MTEIDPVNPFRAPTETVTAELVVPACTLADACETAMEKSGAGGGAVTVRVNGLE